MAHHGRRAARPRGEPVQPTAPSVEQPKGTRPGRRTTPARGVREAVLAVAGSLALACGLTWPLLLNLTTRYPGNRPLDIWVYVWTLWWVRHALAVLHGNPFHTDLLFYPDGTDLYLHTLMPLAGVLALPAGLLGGTTVAYNLTALGGLALAGGATYLLARRWVGPPAAALAGFAFAAAPWVLHQLRVGHLNLMQAGWLPLAILLLLRAADRGRGWDIVLAGLGLLAATLVDWHFTLFLTVTGAVVAVERLATAGSRRAALQRARRLALVAGLYAVLVTPLVVGAVRQGATVPAADLAKFEREQVEYSADLLAYLMPQLLHPLWGRQVNAWLVEHPLGSVTEGRVGLSLTALVLAGLALAARRPGAALWAAVGLIGLVLSLGPRLQAAGVDTGLPMPYALLGQLPLLNIGRTPARFAVLPALAVAVLAGLGLSAARDLARRRWGAPPARAVMVGLAALVVFEYVPVPYPSVAVPSLALAEQVAATAGRGTVLELPYHADDSHRMLFQTVHGRPIFGGYITREAARPFLDRAPVLADLMGRPPAPDILPDYAGEPLRVLATYGVSVIVVYRGPYYRPDVPPGPPPDEAQLRRRVQALLGVDGPDYEDDDGALYRVPPAGPAPVLVLGEGWHAPEPWPRGWMRWTRGAAEVRLDPAGAAPLTLHFTAWSFHRPRTLQVVLAGQPLATVPITLDPRPVAVPLPPGAGVAQLTLRAVEGADTPVALGLSSDPRPLAFGVAELRVAP